ncbi:hypothetical protein BGZ80_011637, partial [Entomortierella chlamydospora]
MIPQPSSDIAGESQGHSRQGSVLFDDQSRIVESGTIYELQLVVRDMEDDTLSFEYTDHLHGTVDGGGPLVSCETIDSILYLKYDDKYLYATNEKEIGLKVDVPERHERLRFLMSDNNTFRISKWDQEVFATLEWIKCSYGAVWFEEGD